MPTDVAAFPDGISGVTALSEAAARRAHGAAGRVTAAGTDAVPQNGVLREHSREHPDTSAATLAAHSNSPISDIMSSSVEGLF